MPVSVVIHYLEMNDPSQLRPASDGGAELSIVRAEIASPELNRFLYTAVGGDWYWCERIAWTHAQWMEYLDRPELETWVGYVRGTPAGYAELERQEDGSVKIAYFGLLPAFIGQGVGGRLLTFALRRGWEMGATRVRVQTCSLDHPAALANYRARGMEDVRSETREVDTLPALPGPWPGAKRPVHHKRTSE
ncbi:MAG: GNAT family N-acetyltransferase [Pirellulales bacterium]